MTTYRHGNKSGFFDGATTFNQSTAPGGGVAVPAGPATFSAAQQVGRSADNFCVYITTSGTSTWQIQVAHSGNQTSDEIFPDIDAQTFVWHDLYYLGTGTNGGALQFIFSGAGSFASLIPDWEPAWVRLRRVDAGAAVTVTAGWEIQAD